MVGLLWQAGSLLDITGTAAWITLGAGWVKIGGSVMTPERALLAVKIVHTVAWAFFAGCILAIPFFVYQDDLRTVLVLIALVMAEVLVILVNRWRCPLTDVAARYTENRADNFDIFLPLWLARYNKQIFGSIFVLDLLYALGKWQRWLP
jgi:hypothetical protein